MPHVMISSKKCTGCHMCELACSAFHEGAYRPSVARLSSTVNPTTTAVKGQTCLQTACAKCEEACPSGAIERLPITVTIPGEDAVSGFVLKVNEDLCTNCGICYDECPYGMIREHPDKGVAFKCDLCDGAPQCAAFCQNPHVLAVSLKTSKFEKTASAAV